MEDSGSDSCVTKGRSDGRRSERTVADRPSPGWLRLGVRRDGGRLRLRAGAAHSGWPFPWRFSWHGGRRVRLVGLERVPGADDQRLCRGEHHPRFL